MFIFLNCYDNHHGKNIFDQDANDYDDINDYP